MVYLLHFDEQLAHAQHYIGFAVDHRTFELRVKHHRNGQGARLPNAVTKAGIEFKVVRVWPDGSRDFERSLKNRRNARKLCPVCRPAKLASDRESERILRRRKRQAMEEAANR